MVYVHKSGANVPVFWKTVMTRNEQASVAMQLSGDSCITDGAVGTDKLEKGL